MTGPAPLATELPRERVLVCVGPSPGSARLVRTAERLAAQLECPWIAAHVTPATPFSDLDRARVESHLQLAEALGAEVARLAGSRPAETLLEYARTAGISRILVGRARRPRLRELVFGSVFEELLRGSGTVEVHVTVGDAPVALPERTRAPRGVAASIAIGFALVAVVTLAGRLLLPVLSDADILMGYLLSVLLLAFQRGRTAAVTASVTAVGAYNFFFVAPLHSFAVADTRNLLTFAALLGFGLAASTLADRLRSQEAEAVSRERRTATLLSFTRALGAVSGERDVARVIVEETATRIAGGAALLLRRGELLERVADAGNIPRDDEDYAVPVGVGQERLGLLLLYGPQPGVADLASGFARQAGLALARARESALAEEATLRARTEELRSALLSTVSHDLRTPLAAITGAATALLDVDTHLDAEARRGLLTSVRDEAARMERLVGNLLEMTRLASGPVAPRREWVPLDELVGGAFARVERTLEAHPSQADLGEKVPLVEVDPVLFEHVLVNLLENAARHTPPGTPITVSARTGPDVVTITVHDEGPGWPPGPLERFFDPFVRGAPANVAGSGLGLAICRGIVEAHGGTIRLVRPERGAAVEIDLPLGTAPSLPEEAP